MHVARTVVPHAAQIEVLENVERLQHHGALHPGIELVDIDTAIGRASRLLDANAPIRQIVARDQTALLLHRSRELGPKSTLVEQVIGGVDRCLAGCTVGERAPLGIDQATQRRRKIGLPENLAGGGCFAYLPQVRQQDPARIRPLLQQCLVALDGVRSLGIDRIAVGQFNRGRQHVGK